MHFYLYHPSSFYLIQCHRMFLWFAFPLPVSSKAPLFACLSTMYFKTFQMLCKDHWCCDPVTDHALRIYLACAHIIKTSLLLSKRRLTSIFLLFSALFPSLLKKHLFLFGMSVHCTNLLIKTTLQHIEEPLPNVWECAMHFDPEDQGHKAFNSEM